MQLFHALPGFRVLPLVLLLACGRDPGDSNEQPITDVAADEDGDGVTADTDCDDTDAAVFPGADETCNGVDDNCDGAIDEGVVLTFYADTDADGFGDSGSVGEACEAPAGFVSDSTDCDDASATTFPGATEVCNGVDDNCDGAIDEGVQLTFYADADADSFGDSSSTTEACEAPAGYVPDSTDCDDASATTFPGATEVCNGVDDNCSGTADEGVTSTFYADTDADTFGNVTSTTEACSVPAGFVADATDCDDAVSTTFPGATEVCNGVDDNCDGTADEGVTTTFYADTDADTFGNAASTTEACSVPPGFVADATDCDDAVATTYPGATEVCNGADDNCDGTADEGVTTLFYADTDADSFGDAANSTESCSAPAGFVADSTDCDDAVSTTYPGATEVCNGVDDNCDGTVDEGVKTPFYQDSDGDSYGDVNTVRRRCSAPAGFVADSTDCDDTDATINPGVTETWYDGIDQACDGGDDYDADGDGRRAYGMITGGNDCNDADPSEFRCGTSATTALPTCADIHAIRPGAASGAFYVDPTGADPFRALCDMQTDGGGWTLCGKFDRDNGSSRYLVDPFARAADNRTDLVDVATFTGAQASQDCRELIRAGATEILSAGTDDGAQPWALGRINNILDEVVADPTNLWDITMDEDGVGTVQANVNITYDMSHVDVGANDSGNVLYERSGMVGDGAMWTNQLRNGANWSNAGYLRNPYTQGDATAWDTVYWSWVALDGTVDDHACGAFVVGTGCLRNAKTGGSGASTYRYNLMFMR